MSDPVFEPLHLTPSPEQRAIQLARKPHLIIEANAGAAKTTTLALRLAQALLRGADPQRVRVLTYTEAAVQAFADAMARIGLGADVRRHVRVQTFDAFCAERLLALDAHRPDHNARRVSPRPMARPKSERRADSALHHTRHSRLALTCR